jgi:hypothetical protein
MKPFNFQPFQNRTSPASSSISIAILSASAFNHSTAPVGAHQTFFKKMNHTLTRFSIWIYLVGIAPITLADSPKLVSPSSDEWVDIYDPPSKVPTEIPTGSKLRGELFDLLRAKASPPTQFSGSISSFRNWAFVTGRTVDRSGVSLKHPPHGNDDAVALWLRTQDGWVVVAHSFGHSDAFFVLWPEQYGVPRELVGMTDTPEAESVPRD